MARHKDIFKGDDEIFNYMVSPHSSLVVDEVIFKNVGLDVLVTLYAS